MKLIIKPRQSGKTSELIRMSEETNAYILTLNRGMAEYVSKMAAQQGYNILFPITLDEYMRSRLKGSHVTHILIDNADMVLQHIFSEATIDAITMSEQEPTVQAVPIPDNATNGDVIKAMFPCLEKYEYEEPYTHGIALVGNDNRVTWFANDWWNAPYKGSDSE